MKKKYREVTERIIKDGKQMLPAMGAVLLYYLLAHFVFHAFCPFLIATGLPCAGCGLTRAFLYLFSGQLSRALYIQPMIVPVLFFGLYCAYYRYGKGERIRGFSKILGGLIAVLLIFYVIRMYRYFPQRIPYVYQKQNLLARFLPGYSELIRGLIKLLR